MSLQLSESYAFAEITLWSLHCHSPANFYAFEMLLLDNRDCSLAQLWQVHLAAFSNHPFLTGRATAMNNP